MSSELPFDPENPPDEPPPQVVHPIAWRLAVRLHREHSPLPAEPPIEVAGPAGASGPTGAAGPAQTFGPAGPNVCAACADPWPCHGRQIAVRGLIAACRPRNPGGERQSRDDR
ncbi:hypothetical protein [Plantactinospora sp. WMMB782]|uniref:hypothetical protein n=1 Tax=Plantactinospora sp. WMMB782 TaxID=3404121 RepID=UPI003B93E023